MMKPRTGVRRAWWSIGALALAGVALSCNGTSPDSGAFSFLVEKPAAPYSSNRVCSLLNTDGNGAQILGQDGGTTNVAEGRVWWTLATRCSRTGALSQTMLPAALTLKLATASTSSTRLTGRNAAALLDERSDEEITVLARRWAVRPLRRASCIFSTTRRRATTISASTGFMALDWRSSIHKRRSRAASSSTWSRKTICAKASR